MYQLARLKPSYRFLLGFTGMKNAKLPISNSAISAVLEKKNAGH
jgi:hypothetical protein